MTGGNVHKPLAELGAPEPKIGPDATVTGFRVPAGPGYYVRAGEGLSVDWKGAWGDEAPKADDACPECGWFTTHNITCSQRPEDLEYESYHRDDVSRLIKEARAEGKREAQVHSDDALIAACDSAARSGFTSGHRQGHAEGDAAGYARGITEGAEARRGLSARAALVGGVGASLVAGALRAMGLF